MNHNFANWEITQLLPEKNPYKSELYCEQMDWYLNLAGDEYFIHLGESPDVEYTFIRNAWSWECIRLYLLSKGYIIDIRSYVDNYDENKFQILYYYNIIYLSTYETDEDFTYYSSYEECREAAILFTLNELK